MSVIWRLIIFDQAALFAKRQQE